MSRRLTHRIIAIAVALFLAAGPAAAHHTMIVEFDIDKPVSLTGTITKIHWVNPHSWIYVDVPNGEGVETWRVETGSVSRMEAGGLFRTTLKLGLDVTVIGFRSRKGELELAGFAMIIPGRPASFLLGR